MGLDFIRLTSGRPYEKRWRDGLDRTKAPSLVGMRLSEGERTVTAALSPACSARSGAAVVVSVAGPDLVVSDGLKAIARVERAPAGVIEAVSAQQGIALAEVERVGAFGTIEVRLTK